MNEYFSTWGYPAVLISDNGPSLVSEEFQSFLRGCGILHVRRATYHPASNGAAENLIKICKRQLKLLLLEGVNEEVAVSQILFSYPSTLHSTTEYTPAELHICRPLRGKLDLLRPNLRHQVARNQANQQHYACGSRNRSFEVRDFVMAKNVARGSWVQAEVLIKLSPVTCTVRTIYGDIWKRHVNQLFRSLLNKSEHSVEIKDSSFTALVTFDSEGSTEMSLANNYPLKPTPSTNSLKEFSLSSKVERGVE
ncbi:uncharacterized protein K02A2.6-like [Fopius arisanus]|uniref:Uncharacterized protein K02A2.6-like n=1 Tax=Fopius arisanus TaxID=64838 RepID=A0A9R1TNB1_9HYME|nr:PREDICTED: uncharacterized protein K02A2.6-like [Fopius arisanus]